MGCCRHPHIRSWLHLMCFVSYYVQCALSVCCTKML
uniref:Uncharacterized protein n=1 Tax=Rhizophora mucronata TaxID=61149 RepID=A0A2P2PFR8_RHIMU